MNPIYLSTNVSSILVDEIKQLLDGTFDVTSKNVTSEHLTDICLSGSKCFKDMIYENTPPSEHVVMNMINTFRESLTRTKKVHLLDRITVEYAQFTFTISKMDEYDLRKRVKWIKHVSTHILTMARSKLNDPYYWILYGRSQLILSRLYQGSYSIIILKNALNILSPMDSIPEIQVMKGILLSYLAMLSYEDDIPENLEIEGNICALNEKETKKMEKISDSKYDNENIMGEYSRILWDEAMKCFFVNDSKLLDANFHYSILLGKWALMPRNESETDVMLSHALRCISIIGYETIDKLRYEDEWWDDIADSIRIIFSATLARAKNQNEREELSLMCHEKLWPIITDKNL